MAQAGFAPAPETGKEKPAPQQVQGFTPAPEAPPAAAPIADDTGIWAGLKRNTVGLVRGMYHAVADPVTPEEQKTIQGNRPQLPPPPEDPYAHFFYNPQPNAPAGIGEKLQERLFEAPRRQVLSERTPVPAGSQSRLGYVASIANNGVNNLTRDVLANVPMAGPMIDSIARRAESGDWTGAATDVASMTALENVTKAPAMIRTGRQIASDAVDIARGGKAPPAAAPPSTALARPASPLVQVIRDSQESGRAAGQVENLTKALPPNKTVPWQPADFQRAEPYLNRQAETVPIRGAEGLRDAADNGISEIEGRVKEMIAHNPQDTISQNIGATVQSRLSGGKAAVDSTFVQRGMQELAPYNLDNPTVAEADDIRWKLNQENKGVLKRNHYDVATARAVDPGFAARELAAAELRDGIYGKLSERGMPGVDELRQDEGALIRMRNAAESYHFRGEQAPPQGKGFMQKVIQQGAKKVLPGFVTDMLLPDPATRDQLITQAFGKLGPRRPDYPVLPARPPVAGLLGEGQKPPLITPPPADTSGTPAVPETGPQTVHPAAPKAPPNAAGTKEEVGTNPRQGVIVQARPMLRPDQKQLPPAPGGPQAPPNAAGSQEVTGLRTSPNQGVIVPKSPVLRPEDKLLTGPGGTAEGPGNAPPTQTPPKPGQPQGRNGATPAKPLQGRATPAKTAASPVNRPAGAAAPVAAEPSQPTPAKPMVNGRLTLNSIASMTDPDALEQIITDRTKSKAMQDAAYSRRRQLWASQQPKPAAPPPSAEPPLEKVTKSEDPEYLKYIAANGQLSQPLRDAATSRIQELETTRKALIQKHDLSATARAARETIAAGKGEENPAAEPQPAQPLQRKAPVKERYPADLVSLAEGQMKGALDLATDFDRPGRYMDVYKTQGVGEAFNAGEDYNFRGVKSSKHIVAGVFPWYKGEDMSITSLKEALSKGKGAAYERIMQRIIDLEEPDYRADQQQQAAPIADVSKPEETDVQNASATWEHLSPEDRSSRLEGAGFKKYQELAGQKFAQLPKDVRTYWIQEHQDGGLLKWLTKQQEAAAPEAPKPTPAGVLPGMGEHVAAQKAGAAQVQGEQMTAELQKPLGSIESQAGDMERNSPLFRGTDASPQKDMFAGKKKPPSMKR